MIKRMPSYCDAFQCLAGACRDSCCIGWEIDIDEKTAAFYDTVGGDFGERLHKNITAGETRSIRLCGERCPFLNEKGLCDIILTLGEEHISEICTEHPRYYAWFEGLKEGGIGLSCEEAARLILTASDPLSFTETEIRDEDAEDYDPELFSLFYAVREEFFALLTDQEKPFGERMCAILERAREVQMQIGMMEEADEMRPFGDVVSALSTLEVMDAIWLPKLRALDGEAPALSLNMSKYLENLAIYFIYRYVLLAAFDGDLLARVKLCAVSVLVVASLWQRCIEEKGCLSAADAAWEAKCYSKEIEYNEDNLAALFDAFYENGVFGTNNLKRFLKG